MIRTFTASTGEIDDAGLAVEELMTGLDLDGKLLKNTIGILACHYDFALSGTVKAICRQLPFETVGTITSAQAINSEAGSLILTLMVLTSDDVCFKSVITAPLVGDPEAAISEAYRANADPGVRPALILSFAGFLVENSGDQYVGTLTKLSGGAPCFGTLAVDDTADFRNCFMLYNGDHYRDRMALVLLYGDVSPKFAIATISDRFILGRAALVTSSEGHILKEVNGRPVAEYFEDLGLAKASKTSYAMSTLPFMLDYGDETPPVSKVFIGLNADRCAICAGIMPEGSTLRIGVFDKEDVLHTTGETLASVLGEPDGAGAMLIYSCISRSMTLGGDFLAELELVRDAAGGLPFMMAYSDGEMCPTQVSEDRAINRFHNNAFILCLL